jgi:hypothetical protein
MKMTSLVVRGFLIWLIPFVVSFFFYSPSRELTVSYALFKSIMVLTLTLVTLTVNWLKPVSGANPMLVVFIYTAMSLVLDIIIVIPMAGLTLPAYVEQIALVYIIIPVVTWTSLAARTPTTRRLDLSAQ